MDQDNDNVPVCEIESYAGQIMTITFNEAASGGYQWMCDPCENVYITSDIQPATDDVGADVKREFAMIARKAGDYVLTFRHKRPWENKSIETLKLALKISS
jgi:predicted secreted protein